MTMYKATISDGRTVTVFGETFRQANREIDEYIKYHYGFRSHEMDYELERVVCEIFENKQTIAFELDTSCHEDGCKKTKEETHTAQEWAAILAKEIEKDDKFESDLIETLINFGNSVNNLIDKLDEMQKNMKVAFDTTTLNQLAIMRAIKDESIDFECRNEAEQELINTTSEILDLLIEKNEKYGDKNLTQHGHSGIMVRLSDKLARLEKLKDSEHTEALEDVYKDIAGYAINGLRLMREDRI